MMEIISAFSSSDIYVNYAHMLPPNRKVVGLILIPGGLGPVWSLHGFPLGAPVFSNSCASGYDAMSDAQLPITVFLRQPSYLSWL